MQEKGLKVSRWQPLATVNCEFVGKSEHGKDSSSLLPGNRPVQTAHRAFE
jgi:hypothetical protein